MAQRSSSAMLNKIRRELARRRKVINVAKGGVVKKSSAAPPPIPSVSGAGAANLKNSSTPLPHPRVLIPIATSGAAGSALIPFGMKVGIRKKSTATTHEAAATKLSRATSHETTGEEYIRKPSSAPIKKRSWSTSVKKGMSVKVRTPARTLTTGQRIVIVHPAVVVSDAEDGYLEVVYSGYPRDRTVRISLDQVKNKNMPPTKW